PALVLSSYCPSAADQQAADWPGGREGAVTPLSSERPRCRPNATARRSRRRPFSYPIAGPSTGYTASRSTRRSSSSTQKTRGQDKGANTPLGYVRAVKRKK